MILPNNVIFFIQYDLLIYKACKVHKVYKVPYNFMNLTNSFILFVRSPDFLPNIFLPSGKYIARLRVLMYKSFP